MWDTLAIAVTQISDTRFQRDANQFQSKIEQVAGKLLKKDLDLRLKLPDQLRLLNLNIWSERYRIPLKDLLVTLFDIFQVGKKNYRVRVDTLPVPVPLLCSDRARQILEDRLASRNDDRETIYAGIQAAALHMSIPTTETDIPSWVKSYRNGILEQRSHAEAVRADLKRRKFRGNPFR